MPCSVKPILHAKKGEIQELGWMSSNSQPVHSHCRSSGVNCRVLIKHVLSYLVAIENDHLAAKEIEANDITYNFISTLMTSIDLPTSRTMSSSHVVQRLPRQ